MAQQGMAQQSMAQQSTSTAESSDAKAAPPLAPSEQMSVQQWLSRQCRWLGADCHGILFEQRGRQPAEVAAMQPFDSPFVPHMQQLAEETLVQRKPLLDELDTQDGASADVQRPRYGISMLVADADGVTRVVCVVLPAASSAELKRAMEQLKWGVGWLYSLREAEGRSLLAARAGAADLNMDALATLMSHASIAQACMALTSALSRLLACDRVCIAFASGSKLTLQEMSDTLETGRRAGLVQDTLAAMEEAVDQRSMISWPLIDGATDHGTALAHQALLARTGGRALLSAPLWVQGEITGCLLFERDERLFEGQELDRLESLAAFMAPVLEEKRRNNRSWLRRLQDDTRATLAAVLGPRAPLLKASLLTLALVLLGLTVLRVPDRLSMDIRLVNAEQRIVAAPFDGYVKAAPLRPGDLANAGDVLVQLDDRDLVLERLRWQGELNKLQGQFQQAVATNDRAQINVVNAMREQAMAQLELVEARLERTRLRAPFDGVVISGDLSRRLGDRVTQGERLLVLAPDGDYRVALYVPQARVADIDLEQSGYGWFSALPEHPVRLYIDKLTPEVVQEDGGSFFLIEARVEQGGYLDLLQPGVEGVGKVTVGEGSALRVWSRSFMDWWRLRWWRWWG